MAGLEQKKASSDRGSERTHLGVRGEWTIRGEKGRGTTREEATATVQTKDDGDRAHGGAMEVGRWEEVRGLTFQICSEDTADRTHCWTACDKSQEIMGGSRYQAQQLVGWRFPLMETPTHCAGSRERTRVGPEQSPPPGQRALLSGLPLGSDGDSFPAPAFHPWLPAPCKVCRYHLARS